MRLASFLYANFNLRVPINSPEERHSSVGLGNVMLYKRGPTGPADHLHATGPSEFTDIGTQS